MGQDDRDYWVVKRKPYHGKLPWIRESRCGTFEEPAPAHRVAAEMNESDNQLNQYAVFRVTEVMEPPHD